MRLLTIPSIRRLAALSAMTSALMLFTASARAGDFSEAEILGFSQDGAFFAFEEYGIQDGSGFPYSTIFVIEVEADRWLDGTPLHRRDELDGVDPIDPDAELAKTRRANRAAAAAVLSQADIAGKGWTAGHNPVTELSADPHRLTVLPRPIFPSSAEPVAFRLEEFALESPDCRDLGEATRGFRLTMTHHGQERVLNEDDALPASRRCPHGYRIERVVTHVPPTGPTAFAVLIRMQTHGFEGPDGRLLAVTGRL